MAEKTVAQKLLIKPGTSVWTSSEADLARVGPLPEDATVTDALADAGVAVLFVADEASLRAALDRLGSGLQRPGVLWIAYPKGGRADINRDTLWPIVAGELGMRPITQVAVDDMWSALRFRPLAPGEDSFGAG